MSLKTKIVGLSVLGIAVSSTIVVAVVLFQKGHLHEQVTEEVNKLGREQCAKIAKDVHIMLQMSHEKLKKELLNDLSVARNVLERAGNASFAKETASWDVTNQLTKQSHRSDLPKMLVGGKWLGQNADVKAPSPVVDEMKSLVGGTCTIFQRMNKAGDMLRVCTNVQKADGTRAIGTYVPAVNADGAPNPVISARIWAD